MTDNTVELFCIFKTNLEETYKIPEIPIKIKSNFTEVEMNQILSKLLLANKKKNDKQFDFLINQELLRGSVISYL